MYDYILRMGAFGVVFSLLVIYAIYTIVANTRLSILSNKIANSPSNELVFAYYKQLKRTVILNNPREWNKLRNTFFIIKASSNVSEDNKESLYRLLISKGCNMPIMHFKKVYTREENERKIRKSGQDGEDNMEYAFKWLPSEYKVIRNIKLNSSIEPQEFDDIIVGPAGIFHIEVKNFGGDDGCKIKINEDGSWLKETYNNDMQYGLESPEFQVQRHSKVIKENLDRNFGEGKYNAHPIIVLSNPKTIVEGADNIKTPVIKGEKCIDYITNFKSEIMLTSEEINSIYNKLNLCRVS